MNIKQITPDIYYTGVNDRVTTLFEGLWPIPYGVSYNSYIVKGSQKTALIDTVRIDEVREYLQNINLLGIDTLDYLVINHMEPDHSGSIPEVLAAYPGIKIVGNSKTIDMVRGFYKIEDDSRFVEVKDGDTLDLGGHTLKFYLTPMVHWPETMMTYVEDLHVLFSGDAFGTFGALNGGVVDDEMETDWYFPEMYRYYTNIVGKYGKFVLAAIKKVGGLQIDYICSTHGPVWHSRIGEVMQVVNRLASYEPEAGVTIIYGSMYGNTAEIAEVIARELTAQGVRCVKVHNASTASMSQMITDAFRYEGLIVGSATYSMRIFPPVETFMNAMETREIKNKVFATFGGYTWAKAAVVNSLAQYAERMKLDVAATLMMKQSIDDTTREEARQLALEVAGRLTKA